MHLSCTDTNTVSKHTEMRFHITHITEEFHRVRPKWFLSLWYIRPKPCTYLALGLAISPNRLNRASTRASSPRNTIRCVKKWFQSVWFVWCKPCTYLVPILTLSLNGPKWDSTWPTSPRCSISCVQMIFEPLVRSAQTMHVSCIKISTLQTDWIELPLEPHHLGVPSGSSKMIPKPMVRLVQTVHLSSTDTNTISIQT
jgi:hypothetical protein